MRQSKKEATKADLSVPLNLDNFRLKESDCFGREWKPDHPECSVCHDIEVCGILYSNLVVPKKTQKVKEHMGQNFLDETNFDRIDKIRLYKMLQEKSGETTTKELYTYVKHYSKCEDHGSILNWIKLFKEEKSLTIKKGIIYVD